MAREPKAPPVAQAADGATEITPTDLCGIIMPISPTMSHDASHWADVQELLHRAVKAARLEPKNVWTGSATDRITPRILSNLFEVPIAVCDISDLNPNVMLELGMRLTSKKPTIVIAESGSSIPFDIRDFEVIFYPGNLNILGMEKFFLDLSSQLQEKLEAYKGHKYEPFLKGIAIDFLEPQGRAVPFEQLVERRLDAIVSRIEGLGAKSIGKSPTPDSQTLASKKRGDVLISGFDKEDGTRISNIIPKKTEYMGKLLKDGRYLMPFPSTPGPATLTEIRNALNNDNIQAEIEVGDFQALWFL